MKSAVAVVWIFLLSTIASAVWAQEGALELNGVPLELMRIRAGESKMGSPETEAGHRLDETQVTVRIAEDFEIGKYPVTRGQFARFIQQTGYRTEAEVGMSGGFGWDGNALVQQKQFNWRNPGFKQTDEHPVVLVTYKDAMAFCGWASRVSGRNINLPSEQQWEYACRAGSTGRFYNGDTDADAEKIAWLKSNAGDGTRPVGQLEANAWGVFDMSGNVFEWCRDVYGPYPPNGRVVGPMDKPRNVLRGGSWLRPPDDARSAARYRNAPGSRNADNGFRIIAAIPAAVPLERGANEIPAVPRVEDLPPPVPEPPVETTPAQPSRPLLEQHSSGGTIAWFIPCGIVLLIAGVAITLLLKAIRAGKNYGAGMNPPPLLATSSPMRIADDGFWIDTSRHRGGEMLQYTFDAPDGRVTRQVAIEPSPRGQFVYTGVRPNNLLLAGMVAGAMQGMMTEQQRQQNATREDDDSITEIDSDTRRTGSASTFRGFPSAY